MHSKDFPEANHALAKDQPEYQTLYCHAEATNPNVPMLVEWVLTDEDIEKIVKNRRLWYNQMTFGKSFNPMLIMVENPFGENAIVDYEEPADENRVPVEEWNNTHFKDDPEEDPKKFFVSKVCLNCKKTWGLHFFSSRQCQMSTKKEEE